MAERWSDSDRRSRLPDDWAVRRIRVLRRDGYRCQAAMETRPGLCLEPAKEVDHIVAGDNHELDNLQTLCRWHHAQKTAQEAAAARRPRPTQRRAPEPHPGLL